MDSIIEQKKKLQFIQKSAEELALEMDKSLKDVTEMTEEELTEQDAEYGYFDNED